MYRFLVLSSLVAVLFSHSSLSATPCDKIAEVAAGRLKEAKASWWGFDPHDSTESLKAAIASKVPRLIVDRQSGPWITGPLSLGSDMEIVFEEGVELLAREGLFHGRNESLISASNVRNVRLVGQGGGAMLRMRKADYHGEAYSKSEWRHGLALRSVENVTVENLSIVSSGGDGIYLGVATRGKPCRNVAIRKVVCDDNNRQGISVISADRLLMEDCTLKNTGGTAPSAGIDFEPNRPDEQLTDCVMRRCTIENNRGDAVVFYLPNLLKSDRPISVRLEQCIVKSGNRYGLNFVTRDTEEQSLRGLCELVDCRFENCRLGGIAISRKSSDGVTMTMKNTRIVHCGDDENKAAPILLSIGELDDFGGIDFGEVRIVDSKNRNPVRIVDMANRPRRISGLIRLERNGKEETIRLDDAWLAREFPDPLRKIPTVVPHPSGYTLPAGGVRIDADRKLPPVWLRREGTFWIYAEKDAPLEFALGIRRIGRTELDATGATLTLPGGEARKFSIPPDQAQRYEYRLEKAPETGIYRLHVDARVHAVRMIRCNGPFLLPAAPKINLIASPATFYFLVPDNSNEFGVRVRGDTEEAVKASVFDPSGRKVWTKDDITEAVQFDRKAAEEKIGGIWKIVLEKPGRLYFEDNSVTILGVPPLLAFTPEELLFH